MTTLNFNLVVTKQIVFDFVVSFCHMFAREMDPRKHVCDLLIWFNVVRITKSNRTLKFFFYFKLMRTHLEMFTVLLARMSDVNSECAEPTIWFYVTQFPNKQLCCFILPLMWHSDYCVFRLWLGLLGPVLKQYVFNSFQYTLLQILFSTVNYFLFSWYVSQKETRGQFCQWNVAIKYLAL